MNTSSTHIRRLMDRVRAIELSPRNQAKRRYWDVVPNDQWEPAQIRDVPRPLNGGPLPFVVQPALSMWSRILRFDIKGFFTEPSAYLAAMLEQTVWAAEHINDDTFHNRSFRILYGTLLEGSMMGLPWHFDGTGYPRFDYDHPPIEKPEDLNDAEMPNFYTSGLMPLILRMYEEMNELLDDDFLAKFPDWLMGPFGVACEMRGFSNFLLDLMLEPKFAAELLTFVAESRKRWTKQRDEYLGLPSPSRGTMGNDDVACPTLSPKIYANQILPFERDLHDFYGKLFYWHSCGNTTDLLEVIRQLPEIELFHVGPWTDRARAVEVFGETSALEFCPDPVDEIQMASEESIRKWLGELVELCRPGMAAYIKVDSLEVIRDLRTELDAIQRFVHIAREITGEREETQ